jgi:hypothetical protein
MEVWSHITSWNKYNFKDEVYAKEYVEFGPQHEALSIAKYRTGRDKL